MFIEKCFYYEDRNNKNMIKIKNINKSVFIFMKHLRSGI